MASLTKKRFGSISMNFNQWLAKLSGSRLYLWAFGIIYTYMFMMTSVVEIPHGVIVSVIVKVVALGLVGFKLCFLDRFSPREILFVFLFALILLLSYYQSGSSDMLVVAVMCLGAKNVNFRSICQITLYIGSALLAILLVLSLAKVIPNYVYGNRNSFGISYTTDFAAHVFYLACTYVYLRFDVLKWWDFCLVAFLMFFVQYFTHTDVDVISLLILLVIMIVYKFRISWSKHFKPVLIFLRTCWIWLLIFPGLIIGLSMKYDASNAAFARLNDIISNRLYYGSYAFTSYGVRLFGQPVLQSGWGGANGYDIYHNAANQVTYFFIDSSYINVLVKFGLALSILFLHLFLFTAIKDTKRNNFKIPLVLLVIFASSCIDQHLFELAFNPFVLVIFANHRHLSKSQRLRKSSTKKQGAVLHAKK
ncbi:hypothetical protein [Lactiplantibacillus plantarum]|uniref:hypothetical protein n=1 Tax=Lactiplantibacillus plantarum TaxID=1590 RepID=UPI001AAF4EF1|nr:hypothetical protein [Lactiplantibacillus plantarum]MBO2727586.1 hypothetical protein [Lactiplantibacillus plantarum]